MKKLLLILVVVIPFFAVSQNQVTLKTGESFIANIKGFYGNTLVFYREIPGMKTNRIEISTVQSIAGEVPKSRIKAILKENPEVKFLPGEFSKQDVKNQTSAVADNTSQFYNKKNNVTYQYSAGDYIQKSARLKLTAYAISAGVGLIAATDSFRELETDTQTLILGVSGGVILGCFLASEFTLIKAGKKMNQDAVSVSAAKNGIGVAINF